MGSWGSLGMVMQSVVQLFGHPTMFQLLKVSANVSSTFAIIISSALAHFQVPAVEVHNNTSQNVGAAITSCCCSATTQEHVGEAFYLHTNEWSRPFWSATQPNSLCGKSEV